MEKNDGALTFLGLIISVVLIIGLVFIFAKTFPENQLSADAQQYLLESMESISDDPEAGESDGHSEEGESDSHGDEEESDTHGEDGEVESEAGEGG